MKTKEQIEAKIARSKARVEARNTYKAGTRTISGRKPKVKGPNTCPEWNDPKLKEKRAKKAEHLKTIAKAKRDSFKPICISYPRFNKYNKKTLENQAKFNMMILNVKQKQKESIKQSKEDKAKYKASLVAFKKTYVRKSKSGTTISLQQPKLARTKKHRNYDRIFKQKAKLAA